MKSLTIILLMLSLQAVISFSFRDLEEPIKKCSVPRKFEGKFKLCYKSTETRITGEGTVHADYTIGKGLIFQSLVENGTVLSSSHYVFKNISYNVDPSRKECRKAGVDGLPGTVPPDTHIKMGMLQDVSRSGSTVSARALLTQL